MPRPRQAGRQAENMRGGPTFHCGGFKRDFIADQATCQARARARAWPDLTWPEETLHSVETWPNSLIPVHNEERLQKWSPPQTTREPPPPSPSPSPSFLLSFLPLFFTLPPFSRTKSYLLSSSSEREKSFFMSPISAHPLLGLRLCRCLWCLLLPHLLSHLSSQEINGVDLPKLQSDSWF
mgnify:CR=1 FL=1